MDSGWTEPQKRQQAQHPPTNYGTYKQSGHPPCLGLMLTFSQLFLVSVLLPRVMESSYLLQNIMKDYYIITQLGSWIYFSLRKLSWYHSFTFSVWKSLFIIR